MDPRARDKSEQGTAVAQGSSWERRRHEAPGCVCCWAGQGPSGLEQMRGTEEGVTTCHCFSCNQLAACLAPAGQNTCPVGLWTCRPVQPLAQPGAPRGHYHQSGSFLDCICLLTSACPFFDPLLSKKTICHAGFCGVLEEIEIKPSA